MVVTGAFILRLSVVEIELMPVAIVDGQDLLWSVVRKYCGQWSGSIAVSGQELLWSVVRNYCGRHLQSTQKSSTSQEIILQENPLTHI